MFSDNVGDYFEGVAAKYLTAVDAEPNTSNQHEVGGLVRAGLGKLLGVGSDDFLYKARQVYIASDDEAPLICDSHVTWYDARRAVSDRGPEYRLYYYDSSFTEQMREGDFFLVAKMKNTLLSKETSPSHGEAMPYRDGHVLMICTPPGSSVEFQLRVLFGLGQISNSLSPGTINAVDLLLPLRVLLEDLGVDLGTGLLDESSWLQTLLENFGGVTFPKTAAFSAFARNSFGSTLSALDDPDLALMSWMEREEGLFRVYEKHIVRERLRSGFGVDGEDVDGFIDFSLSVQNRRKSRVGHAFEGHLNFLFRLFELQFEQGRGKGKVTENKSSPDFLFPSFSAYHNPEFPVTKLLMLGAKTTCKDRWRQVLSEAQRIASKHLVTLEPAISEAQTDEMLSHNLQLVIPSAVHATYSSKQRANLLDINGFIHEVRRRQAL
jgi:hypothetical protein